MFTSFWAALDGRALSSLDRVQSSAAFLNSLLECIVFLVKRLASAQKRAGEPVTYDGVLPSVAEQICQVWTELLARKLRVDENEAGKALTRTLSSFEAIHDGMSNFVIISCLLIIHLKDCLMRRGSQSLILFPIVSKLPRVRKRTSIISSAY